MAHRQRHTFRSGAARPVRFLTDYEEQASEGEDLVIPEDLTTLSDEELQALVVQANEAFQAIYGDGTGLSAEDLASLESLTEGIEALAAEDGTRQAAEQERADAAAALAARIAPPADPEAEADPEADPEAEADPENPEAEADPEAESLAASGAGRRETRVNLASLRGRQRAPRSNEATGGAPSMRDVATAATEGGGFAVGSPVDFLNMGQIVNDRLRTFNAKQFANAAAAGRKLRSEFGVATIHKPYGDLMITDHMSQHEIDEVVRKATEHTGTADSLVASGGWCAPSETIYDIYDCGEVADGLFSIPTVGINRGGIRFNRGVSFNDLMTQTGFHYTEAEDIVGDYDGEGGGSKPCFKIECVDFVEERLDVEGLCLTAGLLQAKGYPEVIADSIRKALIAHEIRVDSRVIAEVVAGSTAVTLPAAQVGATAPILTAIELQAQHYRASGSLADNTVLEGVFPQWVRGVIRSDLSRRLGVDLLSVPNSRINGWFTDRQIAPQFVANWQSIGTTPASGFTSWPNEVDFLLYKAGTWIKGGADVITLNTLYDSTLLGTNDYTALFTEEGLLTARRGCDSRVVTVPICPTGDTGGGVLIDCDGSEGAAA